MKQLFWTSYSAGGELTRQTACLWIKTGAKSGSCEKHTQRVDVTAVCLLQVGCAYITEHLFWGI